MKHCIRAIGAALLLVLLSCGDWTLCPAQTVVSYTSPLQIQLPSGAISHPGQWSAFLSDTTVSIRYGYPLSGNWVNDTMTAGKSYGFAGATFNALANPQKEAGVIEFKIGTSANVTMQYTYYCSATLEPTSSIVLASDGTLTTQVTQPCPPATTLPAALVTPPPVAVAATPVCPSSGPTLTTSDGVTTIAIPNTCLLINKGSGYAFAIQVQDTNVPGSVYTVQIMGMPTQSLFAGH